MLVDELDRVGMESSPLYMLLDVVQRVDEPFFSLRLAQALFLSALSEPSPSRSAGESLRRSIEALTEAIGAGLPEDQQRLLDDNWPDAPWDLTLIALWHHIEKGVIDAARAAVQADRDRVDEMMKAAAGNGADDD